jgi:branched-chain amino acid transport system ATP-binding protein
MNLLEVNDIHTYYGKSHILFGVSLEVNQGSIVGLMGRNGAGKSTTLKSIIGIVPPKSGAITFHGEKINGLAPFRIARRGIGYVPEDRRVFSDLTVYENLEIMAPNKNKGSLPWTIEKIFEIFPKLNTLKSSRGMELSGGEQQMLTIARALMGCPKFLLLDEPAEGLAPLIVQELGRLTRRISEEITILLAEQNLPFVLDLIDYGYIIDEGKIVFKSEVEEIRNNKEIKEKYLGV